MCDSHVTIELILERTDGLSARSYQIECSGTESDNSERGTLCDAEKRRRSVNVQSLAFKISYRVIRSWNWLCASCPELDSQHTYSKNLQMKTGSSELWLMCAPDRATFYFAIG